MIAGLRKIFKKTITEDTRPSLAFGLTVDVSGSIRGNRLLVSGFSEMSKFFLSLMWGITQLHRQGVYFGLSAIGEGFHPLTIMSNTHTKEELKKTISDDAFWMNNINDGGGINTISLLEGLREKWQKKNLPPENRLEIVFTDGGETSGVSFAELRKKAEDFEREFKVTLFFVGIDTKEVENYHRHIVLSKQPNPEEFIIIITKLGEILTRQGRLPYGNLSNIVFTDKERKTTSSPLPKQDDGLCLTLDSLITLANGTQKPLIALKPFVDRVGLQGEEVGDMVLSLNEETQKLEPHRVLALLDMGVKPVYRITTASGKTLKTTLTHPYRTPDGWKKLKDIKVGDEISVLQEAINYGAGEEVAVVSESFGNTAGANDRDFIPSNNYQRIFEKVKDVFFYKWRQDLKKGNRHKGIDFKEDYSFVSSQRESIETNEVSIQRKYNPIFFCAERGNLFITCPFQSYVSGFNDIVAGFLQEFNCAAEKAMVSKQPHSTYLMDNNFFVFEDSCGIVKAGFNVFNSDIRIALLDNLFGSKSLLNKFQDHIQRDSRSFDAGFSKTDFGVNRDSICQSIVSHYFHLLTILYHKIKEASSHILHQNAYAQSAASPDILWDKIVSIEPLGPMPVYDIEVEATHNFIAQGIVAHNTYTGSNQKPVTSNQNLEKRGIAGSPLDEKRKAVSSIAFSSVKESVSDLGGVDFMRLPIAAEPMNMPSLKGQSPLGTVPILNLDQEWRQIQKMVGAGIMPSNERIREYALASSSLKSEDYGREIDKLLGCIADILRLEEGWVLPIEPALREMLVLLESDKSANELQLALSKITVLPKVPQRN